MSCVITAEGHEFTLQIDGNVGELSGAEANDAKKKMLLAEPEFANFFNDESTRFFKISPKWMRLRDYTQGEPTETVFSDISPTTTV